MSDESAVTESTTTSPEVAAAKAEIEAAKGEIKAEAEKASGKPKKEKKAKAEAKAEAKGREDAPPDEPVETRMVALKDIFIEKDFNADPTRVDESKESKEAIAELAAGIAEQGQEVPVILDRKADGKLWLTDGHRRIAAFKLLKRSEIRAEIHERDEFRRTLSNLAANTGKRNHPFYEAKRLSFVATKYKEELGDKPAEKLAAAANLSVKHVQNQLRTYRQLTPRWKEVFKGPDLDLTPENLPPMKELTAVAAEPPEKQDELWELRFGKAAAQRAAEAAGDGDEKEKGKKGEKDKKPKVRKRDEMILAKDVWFRPFTEKQIENGADLSIVMSRAKDAEGFPLFPEGKKQQLTLRERALVRETLAWCANAHRGDFFVYTKPERAGNEEGEDEDE